MEGPDEAAISDDFRRELAARRKDLEREFAEKVRDLKAQEKRRADKLERDRIEWEEYRRGKAQELADREHALKGREGRIQGAGRPTTDSGEALADLRAKLAEVKERRDLLARRQHDLEEKAAKAQAARKASAVRLVVIVAAAVIGALVWLVVALKQGGGAQVVGPVVLLVLVAVAGLWPSPRTKGKP